MIKNLRVTEYTNDNPIVVECIVTNWKVCCNCIEFDSCMIKDSNRMGIIPNLIEDFKSFITELKRIKIKFFMELKGK